MSINPSQRTFIKLSVVNSFNFWYQGGFTRFTNINGFIKVLSGIIYLRISPHNKTHLPKSSLASLCCFLHLARLFLNQTWFTQNIISPSHQPPPSHLNPLLFQIDSLGQKFSLNNIRIVGSLEGGLQLWEWAESWVLITGLTSLSCPSVKIVLCLLFLPDRGNPGQGGRSGGGRRGWRPCRGGMAPRAKKGKGLGV